MTRCAVVLFNLGGPDKLQSVEPFLFNLFNDPAIIALPAVLRWPLAKFIARRRREVARDIYARMGGGSPLVANTATQATALEAALGPGFRTFIAMRYWPPLTEDAVAAAKAWGADEIVLLPLYPQYSSTTTGSSLAAWREAAAQAGLDAPVRALCCYPTGAGFIAALSKRIETALAAWPKDVPLRILLSAHGLPERIVAKGDPYRWQIEATAAAVGARLGGRAGGPRSWSATRAGSGRSLG